MDWVNVNAGFVNVSRSGIDGEDGWLTLGLGLLALWAFSSGRAKRGALACLLGVVVTGYDVINAKRKIADIDSDFASLVKIGNGLWLCLIGAVIGTIVGFTISKQVSAREALAQTVMAQDPPADKPFWPPPPPSS